jgi:hypothetical protein
MLCKNILKLFENNKNEDFWKSGNSRCLMEYSNRDEKDLLNQLN